MPTPPPKVSIRARRVALGILATITFSLVIAATIVTYQRHQPPVQKINYTQLYSLAEAGGAVAVQVDGETLTVTRTDGTLVEATVAGVDEARAELTETIEFLRSPQRFSRLGGRVPRGILLYGPPGTGKTLLARAAAKEAGVAFLAASGSSFQEKFAGLGAARVRHL